MLYRTLALLVTLATAVPARADVHLDAGLGFGAAAYDPCDYNDAHCDDPVSRAFGFAPHFGAGIRERKAITERVSLRYGSTAMVMLVPTQPTGQPGTASVETAAGEVGIELGVTSIDMTFGLSRIHVTDGMASATSAAFEMGIGVGVRFSDEITAVFFTDAHAVMHGPGAALFMGLGISWTPHR